MVMEKINSKTHFVDATMVDGTCHSVMFQGTIIEDGAWRDESNLKEVEIGSGVTEIRTGAFENCTALTRVVLPESVKIIRRGAFAGCTALETVVTPGTLQRVECWIDSVSKLTTNNVTPDLLTQGLGISLLYKGDDDPHYWD